MKSIHVYQLVVLCTVALFITALVVPLISISVNLRSPTDLERLEFVCVWCQYGSVDSDPDGNAAFINATPWDFFYMWIPLTLMVLLSFIALFKAFPSLGLSDKISSKLAINSMWGLTVFALLVRGLLSILIRIREDQVQEAFPSNQVIGELSWGAGALVIGAIMASSSAMFGFIEFEYDLDEEVDD